MANELASSPSDFLIYQTEDGRQRIECRLNQETPWLSPNQIATLLDRDKSVISKHLKNIFEESELIRDSVVAQNATTAADGKTYQVEYRKLLDQQPSEVDKHLADALRKPEQIDLDYFDEN